MGLPETIIKTEKKTKQILNMLQLIHEENLIVFGLIKNIVTSSEDQETLEAYIKQCQNRKEQILSGIYEDEVNTTS